MKSQILKALREANSYVSGQELCEQFQVSRTAVWKAVHQLNEEGYIIEAVRNKGYRIVESPDVLSVKEIESLISTKWAGSEIQYYDETDSTNTRAKTWAENGAIHGALVVADMQSAGKGRRGRSWESPKGTNIYLSIILRPQMQPMQAPMLTLVMAHSIAKTLRDVPEINVKIKWPNDIVLHKKKVCGILTEMSAEIDYINYVVIGVGINVNGDQVPEELEKSATTLSIEEKKKFKRSELIAAILKQFETDYELFCETKDLSEFQKTYNQILVNQDREVRVLEPGNEYNGYALGINETGELLVRREDGRIEKVFAGEVSVRGIYGYV